MQYRGPVRLSHADLKKAIPSPLFLNEASPFVGVWQKQPREMEGESVSERQRSLLALEKSCRKPRRLLVLPSVLRSFYFPASGLLTPRASFPSQPSLSSCQDPVLLRTESFSNGIGWGRGAVTTRAHVCLPRSLSRPRSAHGSTGSGREPSLCFVLIFNLCWWNIFGP